ADTGSEATDHGEVSVPKPPEI
nr:haptoglobin alpha chain {N-terminal} [Ursus arctos=brown bears, serum, Peptide Partial, 21 aa] [Ursus arctos]